MIPALSKYADTGQIDTLRRLLADKEMHLKNIMQVIEEQDDAETLMADHLHEVARRATRVRTITQKKKGIAGLFGGKKTIQVMPSAKELQTFSDSLIAMQSRYDAELEAYSDSLSSRNRELNTRLNNLIGDMDRQVQEAFAEKERKIAEAQVLSMRLFTATISTAIVLLFLSYLAIHRELKRNAGEKKKREKLIIELEKANETNKELIRLRRNLIQNVAHELRTPLSAIGGNAELLVNDTDTDTRNRHAEVVRSSAKRMAMMIDSLLEYFRLDSGKMSLINKPFHSAAIGRTLESEFAPLAAKKGLVLSVTNHADEIVDGDRDRILGIGGNLLSNAIKFTKNGTVGLETNYSGDVFIMTVEDTSTGISKDRQEAIFKPFERLGNAATEDGFGLGLAIVHDTVKLMGGSIGLDSEPGKGSRFTVTLPLPEAVETVSDEKLSRQPFGIRGCSVLAIDNNMVTLGMIHDMFAYGGVDCDICTNVSELVEAMRSKEYDLLITDLKMPDMDGYGILELLRASDIGNSRTIPVVVATAAGYVEEEELKQAGFAALLAKPFFIEELLAVTEKCIGRKEAGRIDLSSLLAFGDRRHTLERLIRETEREMLEIRKAADGGDLKAMSEWIHHARSSWMLIKAERPLAVLYDVVHKDEVTEDELYTALDAVLAQGKRIIDTARKEMERWEE